MNRKRLIKRIMAVLLTLALSFSGMLLAPATAYAAGWLDYVQDLTLGQAVNGSMRDGDFSSSNGGRWYWHVYKITMPKKGLLRIDFESATDRYFSNYGYSRFTIFSASDPDNYLWDYETRHIKKYSAARNVYYGSTEASLGKGDYYFAVRKTSTENTPYSLTLTYQEPIINVSSIVLDKTSLKLTPGDIRTISATVFPDNATDKTIYWKSNKPSVASVENGTIIAISRGSALISATSADGEVSASCTVTVVSDTQDTPQNPGGSVTSDLTDRIKKIQPSILKASAGKKKLSIRFSSIGVRGVKYQVSYKAKGGSWKTKTISKTSAALKGLGTKKKYSVRVRGFVTSGKSTYYSKWSKTKSLKTK